MQHPPLQWPLRHFSCTVASAVEHLAHATMSPVAPISTDPKAGSASGAALAPLAAATPSAAVLSSASNAVSLVAVSASAEAGALSSGRPLAASSAGAPAPVPAHASAAAVIVRTDPVPVPAPTADGVPATAAAPVPATGPVLAADAASAVVPAPASAASVPLPGCGPGAAPLAAATVADAPAAATAADVPAHDAEEGGLTCVPASTADDADVNHADTDNVFYIWSHAVGVVCVPCDTTFFDAVLFGHHVRAGPHKAALEKMGRDDAQVTAPEDSGVAARLASVPTVGAAAARAALAVKPTGDQVGLRERYSPRAWPAGPAAAHVPAVPALSIATGLHACYTCRSMAPSAQGVHKAVTRRASGALRPSSASPALATDATDACPNTCFYIVSGQTLKRGNKTCFFPVSCGLPSQVAAAAVDVRDVAGAQLPTAIGAPVPSASDAAPDAAASAAADAAVAAAAATGVADAPQVRPPQVNPPVSLDAFLGASSTFHSPLERLPSSEASNDTQAGGLLHMERYEVSLKDLGWTAAAVADHFSLLDVHGPEGRQHCDRPVYVTLRAGIQRETDAAIAFLRSRSASVLSRKMRLSSAGDESGRAFNVNLRPDTVQRYVRDTSILLLVVMDIVRLGHRCAADIVADDRRVPTLSAASVSAADALTLALDAQEVASACGGDAGQGGQELLLGGALASPASDTGPLFQAFLLALFHEEYDPRARRGDPACKGQSDVELVMPFVAVVYGSLGLSRTDPARYADASNAQRLTAALLFSIKITNTLYYMAHSEASSDTSFAAIARKSDPSRVTAAAYVVHLSSMAEAIGRSEIIAPVFLPCDDASHAPPVAAGSPAQERPVCGTLLGAQLHMSTRELGRRLESLHAVIFSLFRELSGGYDPAGSGFWADAIRLVDRPSAHAPEVGFLQLPQNRQLVRRRLAHFVASGALESAACPVRPVQGPAASASATAPLPAEVARGAFARWEAKAERLRALLWAAMHVAGGSPGRQTEDAALKVVASSARARRSLFVHAGSVLTVLTYSKGQSRGEGRGRPVLRWMDAKTSSLILLVLMFLDPLQAYVSRATRVSHNGDSVGGVGGAAAVTASGVSTLAGHAEEVDRALLFRDARGVQLSPYVLNKALESGLLDGLREQSGSYVGVRILRQFLAGITKMATGYDILSHDIGADGPGGGTDGVVADIGRVLDAQAGHTSTTATQRYAGLEDLAVNELTAASVFWVRRASSWWHTSMDVESRHHVDGLRHPLHPSRDSGRPPVFRPSPPPFGRPVRHPLAGAAAAADGHVPTPLGDACMGTAGGVGGAASSAATLAVASASVVAAAPTLGCRASRMSPSAAEAAVDAAARLVYGPGGFKSPTQRLATVLTFCARDAVTQLTVLPTGGGKSATFLLVAYIEAAAASNAAAQAEHQHDAAKQQQYELHQHEQHRRSVGAAVAQVNGGGSGCGGCAAAGAGAGLASPMGSRGAAAAADFSRRASLWCPTVTIVLTTTRAVSATILDAAARMPVRAGSWAQRLAPDVAVVVVDATVIVRNRAQFVALIRGLDAQGRLGRVVIDEVHLLGLWGSFRHPLVFVKDVLASLPCPLILLTATAPVRWVQPLLAATGWTPSRPVAILRPPSTRRANLRYCVEPSPVPFTKRGGGTSSTPYEVSPLHMAVADRVLEQISTMRAPSGDLHSRCAVVGVFLETVLHVEGISDALAIALAMADGPEMPDVDVLRFHSRVDGAQLVVGGAPGSRGEAPMAAEEDVGSGAARTARGARESLPRQARARPEIVNGDISTVHVVQATTFVSTCTGGRDNRRAEAGSLGAGEAAGNGSPPWIAAELQRKRGGVGVIVVVGSPGISTGTDFANMSWGFFLGARNLMTLVQASGRLSRSLREGGTAVVWNPDGYSDMPHQHDAREAVIGLDQLGDFDRWAALEVDSGPLPCRRAYLDKVMDGVEAADAVSCIQGGFALCDVCTHASNRPLAGLATAAMSIVGQGSRNSHASPLGAAAFRAVPPSPVIPSLPLAGADAAGRLRSSSPWRSQEAAPTPERRRLAYSGQFQTPSRQVRQRIGPASWSATTARAEAPAPV